MKYLITQQKINVTGCSHQRSSNPAPHIPVNFIHVVYSLTQTLRKFWHCVTGQPFRGWFLKSSEQHISRSLIYFFDERPVAILSYFDKCVRHKTNGTRNLRKSALTSNHESCTDRETQTWNLGRKSLKIKQNHLITRQSQIQNIFIEDRSGCLSLQLCQNLETNDE